MAEHRTLTLVTSNAKKAEEATAILAPLGIGLSRVTVELREPMQGGLAEIALEKATQAGSLLGRPLIVDDAGLFMDAYPGFPGPFSKFVMGSLGYDGLARLLSGCSERAEMRTALAYWQPGAETQLFEGCCRGRLLTEPQGSGHEAAPISRIFVPDGFDRPLALLDASELAKVSHRAQALRALGASLA